MRNSVRLHVYDLSRGLAKQISLQLLGRQIDGIWHTGVLVYGREWFYGGGLQSLLPQQVVERYGMNPVQEIHLGETEISHEVFQEFLNEISPRFTESTYDLLHNNCNNFSNEVSQFLLGHGIPQHIINLPNEALSTPFGAMLRPMIQEMQSTMARGIVFNNPVASSSSLPSSSSSLPSSSSSLPSSSSSLPSSSSFTSKESVQVFQQSKVLIKYKNPLLSTDDSSISSTINRIKEVILQSNHSSTEYTSFLESLEKKLLSKDTETKISWELLSKIYSEYPKEKVAFPILCLLRLIVLDSLANEHLAEEEAFLCHILDSIEQEQLTKSQVFMALCSIANSFAHLPCSKIFTSKHDLLLNSVVKHLKSEHNGVKQMAAAICYNYSCYLETHDRKEEHQFHDLSVMLICSSLEHAQEEKDFDVTLRLLVCIGKLAKHYEEKGTKELLVDLNAEETFLLVQKKFNQQEMKDLTTELVEFLHD